MLFDWKLWRNPKLKRRLKTLSFPRIRFKQSLGKSLWSDLVVRTRSSTFSSLEKGWESQFIVLRIKWLIAVMTRSLISSVRDVSTDVSKRFFLSEADLNCKTVYFDRPRSLLLRCRLQIEFCNWSFFCCFCHLKSKLSIFRFFTSNFKNVNYLMR